MQHIHYALQTCDNKRNTNNSPGWLSSDKATFTRACVNSFFKSIQWCQENYPQYTHHVKIIDDHSTTNTVNYLKKLQETYSNNFCEIQIQNLIGTGVMNSTRVCYKWLQDHGKDYVYQVQDDYLFRPSAIAEMLLLHKQILDDTRSHSILNPHNRPSLWTGSYRYWASPRTVVPGSHRYWIQLYDTPCTFFTSHQEFEKHWDLYEKFFNIDPQSPQLESISLNYMFTQRGVLGLQPVESLALHMQDPSEMDPYVNWEKQWQDAVDSSNEV